MLTVFNAAEGSQLRNLIRLLCVGFTTFGLKLPADQVALIQAALEAVLALFVASPIGDATPAPLPAPPTIATKLPRIDIIPTGVSYGDPDADPAPVDNGNGYIAPLSGDF